MYIVIFASIVAWIFTLLDSMGRMKSGMKWGFILITLLGCIHYNFGNDYIPYYELFKQVEDTAFDWNYIISRDFYREPGWILLCYLFKYLGGFFVMVAVLNIIQNTIVFRFIEKHIPKQYWALSMFIYLFNTGFYLLSFSMMRQEFVMIVFLGLWDLIKERKFIIPLVVLYCCSWVHSSAFILIPFAFWGFVPAKNGKVLSVIMLVLGLIMISSVSLTKSILDYFSYYEELDEWMDFYGKDSGFASNRGIGFIMNSIPFFVGLYYIFKYSNQETQQKVLLVTLALLGFFIQPFSAIIPGAGRIGYYFTIFSLASVPISYNSIKDTLFRYSVLLLYIVMTLYNYREFFMPSSSYARYYDTFHTIFSVM